MSDDAITAVSIFAVVHSEPYEQLAEMMASCAAQDWDGRLDLVIAAPLADRTIVAEVLADWARGTSRFVENPSGGRSAGLNLAVDACDAQVVVRVDARSRLTTGHVRRSVDRLRADRTVGVVGGVQRPNVALDSGVVAEGICLALRNPWMLGGAAYRRPGAGGPVDTVYLGAFRRSELQARRYDEQLDANEDFDLCARYQTSGQRVWLESGLLVDYRPRDTFAGLARQYEAFGRSKVRVWRRSGHGPNRRQIVALGAAALGATAALTQVRRPRRVVSGLAALGAVYAVSDALTIRQPATLAVRGSAVIAHGISHASWLCGLVIAFVSDRGARERDSAERKWV